jgi:hypothetical protein
VRGDLFVELFDDLEERDQFKNILLLNDRILESGIQIDP